jgi:trigger factor
VPRLLFKQKIKEMATVTRENIGLLNEKIVVKVAKDDYLPSFEKAIKNYSKQANIPGFRKGMVPVGMVKKMYGSSVFAEEVIKSVEKGLGDYMANEKLEIFAQPLPLPENDARKLDMNQPDEYAFAFEVGLKPEFAIADLASAPLTRYKIEVTDHIINEEVSKLQIRHGKMSEPETITSEDNVLNLKFVEADSEGSKIEGGIEKENSLLVKYFTEPFRAQLMGKKKGETLLVQLSQAFDVKEREWILSDLGLEKENAEAAAKFFLLEITKIGLVERNELNEEFFEQAFPGKDIKTEEAFREQIKKEIEAQWEMQSRNQLQHQLYHVLLEQTQIEFPADFLKRWMLNGGEKPKTAEQVEQEFPTFVNQLKWTLIVEKIVHENNIEVTPDDIKEYAKNQLLGYMGGSNIDVNQPWINDYLEKMMQDRKFVEDSYHRIQTDKVFVWAESKVNPVEQTVSVDDFLKMQEEHRHHHHE